MFLLLARYVPNDQCNIEDLPTTDRRPTSVRGRAFLEELQTAISS